MRTQMKPPELSHELWNLVLERAMHCVWTHSAVTHWRAHPEQEWAEVVTQVFLALSTQLDETVKLCADAVSRQALPTIVVVKG